MAKQRGILIAGNWKMNHGLRETDSFFASLRDQSNSTLQASELKKLGDGSLRLCIIPPFHCLEKAKASSREFSFPIGISAQNAHWEKKGAFTGELSGPMLHELGVDWVLIGHSERRQFFGETNLTVKKRAESLLDQGFQVILCIGETQAERQGGKTEEILARQLNEAIPTAGQGIAAHMNGKLVIAYEPVWAIGTGLTATPEQAEEAHAFIRNLISKNLGASASAATPLLYGGSVTPENVDALLACANIDGALVGGASLKPDGFLALMKAGARALG